MVLVSAYTQEEFAQQITAVIEELTGSDLRSDTPVFVERYDANGMSRGHINPEWWQTKGMEDLEKAQPLLEKSYESSCFL